MGKTRHLRNNLFYTSKNLFLYFFPYQWTFQVCEPWSIAQKQNPFSSHIGFWAKRNEKRLTITIDDRAREQSYLFDSPALRQSDQRSAETCVLEWDVYRISIGPIYLYCLWAKATKKSFWTRGLKKASCGLQICKRATCRNLLIFYLKCDLKCL